MGIGWVAEMVDPHTSNVDIIDLISWISYSGARLQYKQAG